VANPQSHSHTAKNSLRGTAGEFLFGEAHGTPQLTVVQVSGHQGEFKISRHYPDHDVGLAVQ
jgi:hypothetical protein